METLTKNVFETTFPHAHKFAETMLQLHSMDEAYFLKSGDIRPDQKKVAAYLDGQNVKTLSELAERHVRDMAAGVLPYSDILQVTYACLLKAGILNCTRISQRRKMEQFVEFLQIKSVACFAEKRSLLAYISGVKLVTLSRSIQTIRRTSERS